MTPAAAGTAPPGGAPIFISTGEASGEAHAAALAAALRAQRPGVRLTGMGGERLRAAGVETIADASALAVTGLTEVLEHVFAYRRLLHRCLEHVAATRPALVILTDCPGFHFALARRLRRAFPALPILYYICPKFWAWHYRRVRTLRRLADEVLCILPFEPELLAAEGVPARYVGNPLLDEMDLGRDGTALRKELDLGGEAPVVGLFPGSRAGELRRHLPPLLGAAARLREAFPALRFLLGPPASLAAEELAALAGGSPLPETALAVLPGCSHAVMAASDLVLAKSGTTTLETALYGTPLVGLYRMAPLSYAIGRRLLRVEHFTLPNLLLYDFAPDGEAPVAPVPELLNPDVTPEGIAAAAEPFLRDETRRREARRHLARLRGMLGEAGASERAAAAALEYV
jgi:lipid-A-disaccharide synthase